MRKFTFSGLIALVMCGATFTAQGQVPVTGISLDQTSATITGIGNKQLQLTATVMPANASNKNVTWTSSNEIVARVSSTGNVAGYYGGTAIITVRTQDGGYAAYCTVTVQYGDGTFTDVISGLQLGGDSYYYDSDYNQHYKDLLYKSVNGFTDSIYCLDFSNQGPYYLTVRLAANSPTVPSLKASLYVPKKEFADNYPYTCAYYLGADQNYMVPGGGYVYPALDDLAKVKECTIDTILTWGWFSPSVIDNIQCYNISIHIPWNDMSDPALTGGISYPVQDNVWTVVTDAQTGDVLQMNPMSWSHTNRLRGTYLRKFTTYDNYILCDIYFTSQIPITKAVAFYGDDCSFWNADRLKLKNGGIEKMVINLLKAGGTPFPNSNETLYGYQVFDNLSPDENGIYHISWKMKDLQGNFLDIVKLHNDFPLNSFNTGLYVEGGEEETYNIGIPEYGGQYHSSGEYGPVYMQDGVGTVAPLNPTNDYPEFEIDNGVLMHYHGAGGNVVIPDTVTEIYDLAFYAHTDITSITIPASVTHIGDYAFNSCTGLTSIQIPNGVTSIGDGAFAYCTGLITSITIPSSVTSIGEWAFAYCTGLTSITIPHSITSIGSMALNCPHLYSFTCLNPDPSEIALGTSVFKGQYNVGINLSSCLLRVPVGSASLYAAADQWKDFTHILEITGINDVDYNQLTIYPNPAKDVITVASSELQNETYTVFSISGQVLMRGKLQNETTTINVSALASGIYFIKAGNYAGKFVKQ